MEVNSRVGCSCAIIILLSICINTQKYVLYTFSQRPEIFLLLFTGSGLVNTERRRWRNKVSHGSKSQQCVRVCVCTSDTPLATCKVSLRIRFLLNTFKTAFVSNSLQFVKTPVPEGWSDASQFSFAGRRFINLL